MGMFFTYDGFWPRLKLSQRYVYRSVLDTHFSAYKVLIVSFQ